MMRRMTTITFDTLDFTRRLREAGFAENQAQAVIRVIADAQTGLVTREHFDAEIKLLREQFAAEIKLLRWMIGASLAISTGTFLMLTRLFLVMPHLAG
jgi:hypothetical protein